MFCGISAGEHGWPKPISLPHIFRCLQWGPEFIDLLTLASDKLCQGIGDIWSLESNLADRIIKTWFSHLPGLLKGAVGPPDV